MNSEVKIQIPQMMIEDMVRAEIIRAMPNKEKVIESVVTQAMTGKKDSYSNSPTYFQEAVNKMICDTAVEIFGEWLGANREAIKKALLKYLNEHKQKRLTEIADSLANNISRYGINVNLNFNEKK